MVESNSVVGDSGSGAFDVTDRWEQDEVLEISWGVNNNLGAESKSKFIGGGAVVNDEIDGGGGTFSEGKTFFHTESNSFTREAGVHVNFDGTFSGFTIVSFELWDSFEELGNDVIGRYI